MTGAISAAVSLQAFEGDAQLWEFTVTRNGAALDISGMDVRFNVVRRRGRTAVITSEGGTPNATTAITNGAGGICTVAIASGATDGMAGDYWYELDIEDSSGDVFTVCHGPYSIVRAVA